MSYYRSWSRKADITLLVRIDESGELHARPGADFENIKRMLTDSEKACNLERLFVGEGRDASKENRIWPTVGIDGLDDLKMFSPKSRLFAPTYLREVGFSMPTKVSEMGDPARSSLLSLVEAGARISSAREVGVNGHPCFVVELEEERATTRFFLSRSHSYAVVRREDLTPSGQLFSVAEMSDFVQPLGLDPWLPKRCVVAYYGWETIPGVFDSEPIAKKVFVVNSIDKDKIPSSRFVLEYRMPFTHVTDSTLPQAKQWPKGIVRYQVPLNYADLDRAIQKSFEKWRKWNAIVDGSQRSDGQAEHQPPDQERINLTPEQQRFVDALSTQATSHNEHSAQVRVAVFNFEQSPARSTGGLQDKLTRDSRYSWKWVNAGDIKSGALEDFDVVIFPGGVSSQQGAALGKDGRSAVKKFVREGGGYIGICAGAGLTNAEQETDLAILDSKTLRGTIEFPGIHQKFSLSSRNGPGRAELTEAGQQIFRGMPGIFDAFFSGGPIFVHDEKQDALKYVPLAMYRTEVSKFEAQKGTMINTPAIIAGSFGKRRIIAFSFHPEVKGTDEALIRNAVLAVSRRSTERD